MKIKRRYLKFLRFLLLLILLILIVLGILWITQPNVKKNVIRIQTGAIKKPVLEITKYESKLSDWIKAWRRVMPNLDLHKFKRTQAYSFKPLREEGFQPGLERDKIKQRLFIFSPDKSKYLDIYEGMGLSEENGVVWAIFDVDTGVALVDLKSKKYYEILFSGPSAGGFHDAFWINNDSFVIAASQLSPIDTAYLYSPILYVFDLADNTLFTCYSEDSISEDVYYNIFRKQIWSDFSRKHPEIRFR